MQTQRGARTYSQLRVYEVKNRNKKEITRKKTTTTSATKTKNNNKQEKQNKLEMMHTYLLIQANDSIRDGQAE